jgi:hypothetical protein
MLQAIPLLFFLAASPEQRGVEYLAGEVQKWSRENHCFSCHNNGDAARALFRAARTGFAISEETVADTIAWLRQPADWEKTRSNPGFSNPVLARIQFAAALSEARLEDRAPLLTAAESLAAIQEANGSWRVDTGGLPGAPATYGTVLATCMARRTLERADAVRFAAALARADAWLTANSPGNTLDAAAMLWALPQSEAVRKKSLDQVLSAQTREGGWGPRANAAAEAFDTAVVLLALEAGGVTRPIPRGRAFLIGLQQASGGWPETTRPSGQISYAEHISTTAWVLYALLATRDAR